MSPPDMRSSAAPRLLLRVEEAADVLGISRTTLYELLKAGHVRAIHIGRSVRVPVTSLEEYVAVLRRGASLDKD